MNEIATALDPSRFIARAVDKIPDLIVASIILALAYLAFRITRRPIEAVLRRAGFHETLIEMVVGNIYRMIILAFALIMAADQMGVNVGAAVAGLGVVGIAVGFAAQDSLANTIAGFLIFWDKPFAVGDWVTVAAEYGRVSNITMRSTRIRTNSNTYVVIPNKKIIDEVLVNHSKHGETRINVPIGIAYKEDILAARDVLLAAARGVEGVLVEHAPDVVVTELGDSSVNLLVRVWIEDASLEQPVFYQTLEAGKRALDAAGIQIPYPHLQLFVDNVEDRVWERLGRGRASNG